MADTWTLITPAGPYVLNPTFSAPKYQPGSVSGPGALRRDDRNTYQRSGDGLATPGPLTLIGRVWRDDQDQALMLQELEAIRAAVATCTTVTRSNNAGEYVYDSLAGGATPEITRDGLGGWRVKLDLWPGRAEPTYVPRGINAIFAGLQYYTNADAVTLALPNVAEGDLVLIIDYAHGGSFGGRNGDRLVPVPDTDWTSYWPGGFNGMFSSYARTWPAGGAQSLDLASAYASDRIVAVVVLRYASSDPNDWVFSARHTETVDQYFETPAATLPRSGYQVGFAAERAFPDTPVFSGTPFTTPTGLERLAAFDGAGVRLKGVLGGAPAPAGPIGGAEADAGEFRLGGGWEFTFGAESERG